MRPARRRLVFLSAAIAALAVVLPPAMASSAAGPAAGTRVGASHQEMILNVGVSGLVCPGQGRDEGSSQPQFAAGARVAAEDAGGASIPDSTIMARGGQSPMPPAGEVFSGAQGRTAEEAGQGVVHGSFRWTTAGDIRGGTVEPAPEFNERVGQTNYQHTDVCLGEGACQWSDLTPNVAKSLRFGGKDYLFYDGYLGWGPR